MDKKLVLIEHIKECNNEKLENPVVDGVHAKYMEEYLTKENGERVAKQMFSNAAGGLRYFSNPYFKSSEKRNNLSRILCLGRVQSGKTGFFIFSIAFAFDNNYDIAYLIGGTKNALKSQNFNRVKNEFFNNPKVKVYDVNDVDSETIIDDIKNERKVVLICLKHSAKRVNLGKAKSLSQELCSIPSIVIDDEGDEYTPGAPNLKIKKPTAGRAHDDIVDIISNINNVTFLSVTATPQANLLLSIIDEISPDFAVLIQPGDEYTGGNAFHDSLDNPHVVPIADSENFQNSTPNSFKEALYFFVFCACLVQARGQNKTLSMLVHPSRLTKIQNNILDKISAQLKILKEGMEDKQSLINKEVIEFIRRQKETYLSMNNLSALDVKDEDLIAQMPSVAAELGEFVFNTSVLGKQDIEMEEKDTRKYRIYVGGNMLGRGLTFKNLIVSYIYRDAKETAVDTLYQRARWLGYKRAYFDMCRVYMTKALQEKFIATVENENDLWSSLQLYLQNKKDIKEFPRLFQLNDDKLILTRKTVSKTRVVVKRVLGGFTTDRSLTFENIGDKEYNRELFEKYYECYRTKGEVKFYSNNNYQEHLIISTTFGDFYDEFLEKYRLPKKSRFSKLIFDNIRKQILNKQISNKLFVIIMRHKVKEYRTPVSYPGNIEFMGELLQSYDNGTGYPGDRNLPGFDHDMSFQIHLVYTEKNRPDDYAPILAFKNPLSLDSIRYVTGENYYDTV